MTVSHKETEAQATVITLIIALRLGLRLEILGVSTCNGLGLCSVPYSCFRGILS